MKMTLAEVLTFGGLSDAKVIAGKDHLDNLVESVTTIEVTEEGMVDWIFENQLYISAMYSIKDDVSKQAKLISMLHEKKCSGLVLCHIGIWMKEIHKDIIALCNQLGFPLIKANPNTMYMDILYPILNRTQKGNGGPENQEGTFVEINRDILNMILDAEDVSQVFEKIAKMYRVKINYLDSYCNCLYSNKKLTVTQAETNYIREHLNVLFRSFVKDSYAIKEVAGEAKLIYLVKSKNTTIGFLVLDMQEDSKPENMASIAAVISTAYALMSGRTQWTIRMKDHYVEEFVADLLVWNFKSEENAVERAQDVGIDILDKNTFCVINFNDYHSEGNKGIFSEELKKTILPKITEIYTAVDKDCTVLLRSDQILVLLLVDGNRDGFISANKQCVKLLEEDDISAAIGISEQFKEPKNIPAAYGQASSAYSLARKYGDRKVNISYYHDVFFLDRIGKLKRDQKAMDRAAEILKPVVEYDREHDTNLLETLKVLLLNNNDVKKSAEQLFTHRNTVIYRRTRIEELYGYSPLDVPHNTTFFIAFALMDWNTPEP